MRSFTPSTLVSLPVVDAHEAIALATAIEAAAHPPAASKKKKDDAAHALPKPVSSAIALVAAKRLALQQSVGAAPPPTTDRRAADHAEDTAVGALYDLLSAWQRLPDAVPQAKTARSLEALLFSEAGVEIVHYTYKAEWTAVEALLHKIDAAVEKQLATLGAGPMIAHLREVHDAYGKAIGVTKASAPVEPPKIREQREALLDAVRTWVLRVAASVDAEDASTQAQADAWLEPLKVWESTGRPKKAPPVSSGAGGTTGSATPGDAQKK